MEAKGSVTPPLDRPVPRWSVGSASGFQYGSFVNSLSSLTPKESEKPPVSPRRANIAIAVLCYINLINYMERYTIAGWMISCVQKAALHSHYCLCFGGSYSELYLSIRLGVLIDIQSFFGIKDSTAGLLQTGQTIHILEKHPETTCMWFLFLLEINAKNMCCKPLAEHSWLMQF